MSKSDPRFLIMGVLNEKPRSVSELQRILTDVSPDVIRQTVRTLEQWGIVSIRDKRQLRDAWVNRYCLNNGVFCIGGLFFVTDPLCFFPCPNFSSCTSSESCHFIHRVSILLDISIEEVRRIE